VVERVELSTRDAEVGYQAIKDAFVTEGSPTLFHGTPRRFDLRMRSLSVGELSGDAVRIRVDASATSQPMTHFYAGTALGGQVEFRSGREEAQVRRGDALLLPTDAGHTARWEEMEIAFLRLPLTTIARVARSRAGAAEPLRFTSFRALDQAADQQWQSLTGFMHRWLSAGGPATDSPLVVAQMVDLLAASALAVFPNSTMSAAYDAEPGPALPAVVRRAVEYIDAHAGEPITLADIAEAARVSPRALQLAFRRRFGVTPTGYLRRVRLEGAHRDLLGADPESTTVADVAARWGFGPSSRFSAFYREQYGVLPSESLRT
jgi:AraC-like DNA-binding protein